MEQGWRAYFSSSRFLFLAQWFLPEHSPDSLWGHQPFSLAPAPEDQPRLIMFLCKHPPEFAAPLKKLCTAENNRVNHTELGVTTLEFLALIAKYVIALQHKVLKQDKSRQRPSSTRVVLRSTHARGHFDKIVTHLIIFKHTQSDPSQNPALAQQQWLVLQRGYSTEEI